MRTQRLFFVISALLFTSFFYSCEPINDLLNDEEYYYSIYADKYEVQVFESVTLFIDDYNFSTDQYSAIIADKEVLLRRISNQELSFMIPYIEGGLQYMYFNFEGTDYEIEFQINSSEIIESPSAVIDEQKTQFDLVYDSLLYAQQEGILSISTQNLQTLASLKSDFEQQYTNATEEEKQELAQLMQANPNFFDLSHIHLHQFDDDLSQKLRNDYWEDQLNDDQEYITALVMATAASIVMFNGTLYSGNPFLIAAMTLAIATEFILILDQVETMWDRTYKPFDLELSEDKKSLVLEFDNHIEYQLGIDASYRSLYKNDQQSSEVIIELVASINTFTQYWNQVSSLVPGLVGNVENINDQNDFVTHSSRRSVNPQFMALENISNSNVLRESFTNNNTVKVTFATNATEDQDFSFDLVYNNLSLGNDRITIDARVKVEIDSTPIYEAAVIGNWTVTNLESGQNRYLTIEPNGEGYYFVEGSGGDDGEGNYFINWNIYKTNGKYFLRENGFWHFGFEQYRTFDISLPNIFLTYPVSSFKTYTDFNNGEGPNAGRLYTKN